jgi:ribonuclease E
MSDEDNVDLDVEDEDLEEDEDDSGDDEDFDDFDDDDQDDEDFFDDDDRALPGSEPEGRLTATTTRTADPGRASRERKGSGKPAYTSPGVVQDREGEQENQSALQPERRAERT